MKNSILINPINKNRYSIFSKEGKTLLRKYIKLYKYGSGGEKELTKKDLKQLKNDLLNFKKEAEQILKKKNRLPKIIEDRKIGESSLKIYLKTHY